LRTPPSTSSPPKTTSQAPRGEQAPRPPVCLGLTGGIGSGKSAALHAFARRGAAVLSADDIVHRLYRDADVIAAVRGRFGDQVIAHDGSVDRAVLGPLAFAQDGGIPFLEHLLHPRIGHAREAWVAEQRALRPPPPLLVCEVPLLFETGLTDQFDAVFVVTASEAVRRRRVAARGQEFAERSTLQWDEARKVAAAEGSYVNDASPEALDEWAGTIFTRFTSGVPHGTA